MTTTQQPTDPQAPKQEPEPKICLGCGRRQEPDGSLPCGH